MTYIALFSVKSSLKFTQLTLNLKLQQRCDMRICNEGRWGPWAIHSLPIDPAYHSQSFSLLIYKWTYTLVNYNLYVSRCYQNMAFVLFCWFFCCACQYFANIQFKKHTLELNYYLQVNISQFFFLHLPSAILVATTLNSTRYIICPKRSFHVTQPSLVSIEPDFPFYMASHIYWEPRNGALGADTR